MARQIAPDIAIRIALLLALPLLREQRVSWTGVMGYVSQVTSLTAFPDRKLLAGLPPRMKNMHHYYFSSSAQDRH